MLDNAPQPLITESYRQMNRELHAEGKYGIAGSDRIPMIQGLAKQVKAQSILDYGSGGNRWLENGLGRLYDVRSYDPCIDGLEARPEPADVVACMDVLGHVEPDCLDAVLDDLLRCTGLMIMLIVETGRAKKFLPDGRNAHLIQQPLEWWMPKLMQRWHTRYLERHPRGFLYIGATYKDGHKTEIHLA